MKKRIVSIKKEEKIAIIEKTREVLQQYGKLRASRLWAIVFDRLLIEKFEYVIKLKEINRIDLQQSIDTVWKNEFGSSKLGNKRFFEIK